MKIPHDVLIDETRKPIRDKLNEFDGEIFNYIMETLPAVNTNTSKTSEEGHAARVVRKLDRKPSCWGDILDKYFSADEMRRSSLEFCREALTFITMKNTLSPGIGILLDFDETCENLPPTEKACQEVGEEEDLIYKLGNLDSARAKVVDIHASLPEVPGV